MRPRVALAARTDVPSLAYVDRCSLRPPAHMLATQPARIGRKPTFVSTNRGHGVPNHGAQFSLTHPPNPITLGLAYTAVSWRSVVPNAARSKEPGDAALLPRFT